MRFPPPLFLVRRRNAARKRKLNADEKSKSTDTEDDSTFDDEGLSLKMDLIKSR